MKEENVVSCPPCGESTLKGGKGVVNKETLIDNPPSALCATSPTQGGKLTAKGFTLIELLVVVLIIGILAAVAVPQYQVAVWRSRNVQLKTLVSQLGQAQQRYFLANGSYAKELKDLDVDIPAWTSARATKNDCDFTTAGEKDSVRYNEDFQIALASSGNVFATWISGPYQCNGFSWRISSNQLLCAVRDNFYRQGKFCKRLEKAIFLEKGNAWFFYKLP